MALRRCLRGTEGTMKRIWVRTISRAGAMYGQLSSTLSEQLRMPIGTKVDAMLDAVRGREGESSMEGAARHSSSTELGATFSADNQGRRGRDKGVSLSPS